MHAIYLPSHDFDYQRDRGSDVKIRYLKRIFESFSVVNTMGGAAPADYKQGFRRIFFNSDVFDNTILIGHSLGSYWARKIGMDLEVPYILLSPIYDPDIQLSSVLSTEDIRKYVPLRIDFTKYYENRDQKNLIIAAKDDEVVPWEDTLRFFRMRCSDFNIIEHGGHNLDNISQYERTVRDFVSTIEFLNTGKVN